MTRAKVEKEPAAVAGTKGATPHARAWQSSRAALQVTAAHAGHAAHIAVALDRGNEHCPGTAASSQAGHPVMHDDDDDNDDDDVSSATVQGTSQPAYSTNLDDKDEDEEEDEGGEEEPSSSLAAARAVAKGSACPSFLRSTTDAATTALARAWWAGESTTE